MSHKSSALQEIALDTPAPDAVVATSPAPEFRSDESSAAAVRDSLLAAIVAATPGKASEASGLTNGALSMLARKCATHAAMADSALIAKGKKPQGKIPVHGVFAADALALAIGLSMANGTGAEKAVSDGNAKYRELVPSAQNNSAHPVPLFKRTRDNMLTGGQTAQHGARFAVAPWNQTE